MILNVTAECIARALSERENDLRIKTCPVAQALHDAGFPTASVYAHAWTTDDYEPNRAWDAQRRKLPEPIQRFIREYDAYTRTIQRGMPGNVPKPHRFRLPL